MLRLNAGLVIILTLGVTFSSCSSDDLDKYEFTSDQTDNPYDYIALKRQGFDAAGLPKGVIMDHRASEDYVFAYVDQRLVSKAQLQSLDVAKWFDGSENIDAIDPVTLSLAPTSYTQTNLADEYHDYDELTDALKTAESNYPEFVTMESAGKSVKGRELWYLRLSNSNSSNQDKAKLLYIGNMHGDETVGREMLIYLIEDLLANKDVNNQYANLLDHAELFIMPSMNPDGFEDGRRWNANFSDLNRDFPDFTSDPNDTTAGRQPETAAVMRLHSKHHFVVAMNLHGGTKCMNLPWDTRSNRATSERFGDVGLLRELAVKYTSTNESMRNNNSSGFVNGITYGYEWYEVDGGMQDWANYYRRSIHATAELSYKKYPGGSTLDGFWKENKQGLVDYFDGALFGHFIKVADQNGARVDSVEVRVDGSSRWVKYDGGNIFKPTDSAGASLWVRATGFTPVHLQPRARRFDGTFDEVTLD